MRTTILLLCLTLLIPVQGNSDQQQRRPDSNRCTLNLDQSPTVRGLKLGQSIAEVRDLFPEADHDEAARIRLGFTSLNLDEFGVTRQHISSTSLQELERLKGIRNITLEYIDGKLASFRIHYDYSTEWQSSAHFAAAIAEQLKIPTTGWQTQGKAVRLSCDGFFVDAFSIAGANQLILERADLKAEISRRQSVDRQRKRVEFKP